jgi:hypothetical protein
MSPRTPHRNSGRRTWQLLLVLLAVLAAGAQQLVAQTHWHATAAVSGAVPGSTDDGAGKHDDCLWCRIAAHASAAAPPVLQRTLLAPQAWTVLVSPERHAVAISRPAHSWQSRGPPHL